MKKNNNSSSLFHHRDSQNNNDDECPKHKLFVCEFCHKHDDHHHHHAHKTTNITFSLYSDITKENKHSWTRVFPSNMSIKPTASTLKPSTQNELPPLHSLGFLPPKKRITKFLAQHPLANNIAPRLPLLAIVNLDLNHPDSKRMKLSSNVNGPEKMQKPFVPVTCDRPIDETVVSLSSSPSYHQNADNMEQKRHSWNRVLKGTVYHPPTALEPCQQKLPAVDFLSLLPPRSYIAKKRSRRYLVHDGLANNTAPIPLLDMSRASVANLDLNHHPEYKSLKLSSIKNDSEMMQKQHVLQRNDRIDETVVKEEKNQSEGETAVSRVVRNFDLNELPTNDVEMALEPRFVCEFDLNDLPTNDVADGIIHH